jgi:hypothetical protein
MNQRLQIGEVAKRAGVSIDTLCYYEKVKLLARASRSTCGFRFFAAEHIERVHFIKQTLFGSVARQRPCAAADLDDMSARSVF